MTLKNTGFTQNYQTFSRMCKINVKEMSSSEILELVRNYQKLKKKPHSKELELVLTQLVEVHAALIIKRVNYFLTNVFKIRAEKDTLEMLFQEGILGLFDALKKFNFNENVVFSTYAVPYIDRNIRIALKNTFEIVHYPLWIYDWENRENLHNYSSSTKLAIEYQRTIPTKQRYISMGVYSENFANEDVISTIGENEVSGAETMSGELFHDAQYYLKVLTQVCSERELKILKHYYVDGFSLKEIGDLIGLSSEGINKIKNQILNKLMKDFSLSLDDIVLGVNFSCNVI